VLAGLVVGNSNSKLDFHRKNASNQSQKARYPFFLLTSSHTLSVRRLRDMGTSFFSTAVSLLNSFHVFQSYNMSRQRHILNITMPESEYKHSVLRARAFCTMHMFYFGVCCV